MNMRRLIKLLSGSTLAWVVFFPLAALAQTYTLENPLGEGTTFCILIKNLVQAAMIIGVPVAVFFVVLAGVKFVLARGNTTELAKARQNFGWTMAGIAIFFGAWLITYIIVNTLQQFQGVIPVGSC